MRVGDALRVAVLGSGFMGQTHVAAWRRVEGVRLVAVVGRRADAVAQLAAETGARAGLDLLEPLRADDIDVIDITLPTPFHAPIAIAALRAGKSVIVEKPMALSLRETQMP